MNNTPPAASSHSAVARTWQWLRSKRVSYLTLPLIIMATITEFVILATGWKYQKTVCLPQGMGVTFFGIGPIGATILAVELLKLPLAVWTASRRGWQKGFMLLVGLPLICVLTFQLVKDMAVYEMGVALTPASQLLEQAAAEENKIVQLNNELAGIERKKSEYQQRRAELAARHTKAKADLEEALQHQGESRQDAITLTQYQQKELAEVESRQAAIIRQFDADAAQLTQALATLRAQREIEVARAAKWNAEEARIENDYKLKIAAYANTRAAYQKARTEYDNAHPLRRLVLQEPVDPGVPPVRESNTILKPVEIAELDAQIKAKDTELAAVNSKRRDRVAQVDADARRVREEFDRRSTSRRAEVDHNRNELLAAHAALATQWTAEQKQIDLEYDAVAQKVDGVRAELDGTRAKAEQLYEARETAIKNTQVHRIATTVEIVRGLLFGQRPISITASAKERGDLYTDQISMVRIWVYPVFAFIVAFLPTLMVELGFSTAFKPDQERPRHRLGFFGRRLHSLYTRAGRHKVLRAERLAKQAAGEIARRDHALADAQAAAQQSLAAKDAELQSTREQLTATESRQAAQLQKKEDEWVAKYTELAESLNRAVAEKDALRDLQKSEVERQIQMRQKAWSDRVTQLRQELDDQRAAFEAERSALVQEHHEKLMAATEEAKAQVVQARRQAADTELAAVEKTARLAHELAEALQARDAAQTQLQQESELRAAQLAELKATADRELEKAVRQEKQSAQQQRAEFEKRLCEHTEEADRRLKRREQELTAEFNTRSVELQAAAEQVAHNRQAELERRFDVRLRELDTRWGQELQQREAAAELRLKQREQQLVSQSDLRVRELQAQAEQELRVREMEAARKLEAQARGAELQLRQELQQKDLAFQARFKQREQELAAQAAARESELQARAAADLRQREQDAERQVAARIRAAEARLSQEAEQRDEMFQAQLRQREQEWQSQSDAREAELKAAWEQDLRAQEQEALRTAESRARAVEARWSAEVQQREELFQSKLRQRDEQWQAKFESAETDLRTQAEHELRRRELEAADARSRALREQEARLRTELQAQQATAQTEFRKREAALMTELASRVEAHETAEKERDKARLFASEVSRQVQEMKTKLTQASSLLTGFKDATGGVPQNLADIMVQ